jgi:sortase A
LRGARQARGWAPASILGWLCILAGLALIAWTAAELGLGYWHEQQLDSRWQQQLKEHPAPAVPAEPATDQVPGPVDGVAFAIRVPKIGYYHAVQEGVDSAVLLSGPGHYPGTAWPGRPGNVGVAAHNTYWIKFGDLRAHDEVQLETRWGTYRYEVTEMRIVQPSDRTILVQTPERRITLTTCWPLWAGAFAQQRLVIFADQFSPAPPGQRGT